MDSLANGLKGSVFFQRTQVDPRQARLERGKQEMSGFHGFDLRSENGKKWWVARIRSSPLELGTEGPDFGYLRTKNRALRTSNRAQMDQK